MSHIGDSHTVHIIIRDEDGQGVIETQIGVVDDSVTPSDFVDSFAFSEAYNLLQRVAVDSERIDYQSLKKGVVI